MDGLRPKGHAGTVDHPGGCPGQNILEIKNTGRRPHLGGKGEEEDDGTNIKMGCGSRVIMLWTP